MNCHYCGTELRDNEIFCHHCGTRQQNDVQAVPQAAAVAVTPAPGSEQPPISPAANEAPAPKSAPVYEEKIFGWQPYGGAPAKEEPLFDFEKALSAPKLQLPVKRNLVKMFFLGILTLGIYPVVIWSRLVGEVNLVASRYDGERSMSFFGMLMLSPLTLGIHTLVWFNKLCRRIGSELQRRSLAYTFGARDFWIWSFLMSLLSSVCFGVCGVLLSIGFDLSIIIWVILAVGILTLVGPFVFTAKLMRAMNRLNEDYNING